MALTNDELNKLQRQRQELQRILDAGAITPEEYDTRLKEITDNIKSVTGKLLEEQRMKQVIEMAEEKKKKEAVKKEDNVSKKPKVAKENKEPSYQSLIYEALLKKTNKSADDVVKYVLEKKPGKSDKLLRTQVSVTTSEIKSGKRKGYKWNTDGYGITVA
jgi:hypothetical protein